MLKALVFGSAFSVSATHFGMTLLRCTEMISGDLEALTGGYEYDRRIIGGLRHLGWTVDVESVRTQAFPTRRRSRERTRAGWFSLLADGSVVMVDGLAFGALAVEAEHERRRLRFVALVHHPLADETEFHARMARSLEASERRALATTRAVVVTSRPTADGLARYGVSADRIAVVEPGTDPASLSHGSDGESVHLLCVAALIPRKGHEVLVEALARIGHKSWHLTCVGSLDRDPRTAVRVRALLAQYDLADRVTFTGDLRQPQLDREIRPRRRIRVTHVP